MSVTLIRVLGLATFLVSFVGDQLLKDMAHTVVRTQGVVVIAPGLNIVAVQNSGVAFGLAGTAAPWLLMLPGMVITAALSVWLLRSRSLPHVLGLSLVIGGALGNLADRLRLGSVRDFIDVYWNDHHWPSFNLADIAIVTGLALAVLFQEEERRAG